MQIKTVYSEFLFDCEVKHFTPKTMKGYKNNLSRLFNYLDDRFNIQDIEEVIQYDLPNNLSAITVDHSTYEEHRLKIENSEEKLIFEQEIRLHENWTDTLINEIRYTMPALPEAETRDFDYFLVYNETMQTYNQPPANGITQSCYILAYNIDLGSFYVIHYNIIDE